MIVIDTIKRNMLLNSAIRQVKISRGSIGLSLHIEYLKQKSSISYSIKQLRHIAKV